MTATHLPAITDGDVWLTRKEAAAYAKTTTVSMLLRGIERACSNCSSVKTTRFMRSPPFP